MPDGSHKQNRLAYEKSPYLLQHADNPVNWYPWKNEAFQKAREQDKPVFLSIGYATCHWCHVMAHESFEDPAIADMMNQAFINIKVDREERPDIDHTYMLVCQMLTGSGGWPLNVLMTPDKKPFYAATYIPKNGRHGRPGMRELIPWMNSLWEKERDKIFRSSEEIVDAFKKSTQSEAGTALSDEVLDEASRQFENTFDDDDGGFGNAPKFPSPHNLMFLLRQWKRTGDKRVLLMVNKTLTYMRRGGIFDHIGYGFHRYSTDTKWLVPHFEKMLYDQAMLSVAYTEGWHATGDPLFKQTTEEILEYVLRDLQDTTGGFYSAEDADSEGIEGKFYVWSAKEIKDILPLADAALAIEIFNITKNGNYEDETSRQRTGKNILHLKKSVEELAAERAMDPAKLQLKINDIRQKIFNIRKKRRRPLLDDKILTDWNGLMIVALAKAGNLFNNSSYVIQAKRTLNFILKHLLQKDGSLLHRYRDGEAAIPAHADDYAFLIWGLLELYEATFNIVYLEKALELNAFFINKFWDKKEGGFFFTGREDEELLGRQKEIYDGAIPSGNSVSMMNLIRLGRITANTELEEKAEQISRSFASRVQQAPTGFTQLLQDVSYSIGPFYEIIIAADPQQNDTGKMLLTLNHNFIPNKIVVLNNDSRGIHKLAPYTQNQPVKNGKTTAYVCHNYSCQHPTNDPDELSAMLEMF